MLRAIDPFLSRTVAANLASRSVRGTAAALALLAASCTATFDRATSDGTPPVIGSFSEDPGKPITNRGAAGADLASLEIVDSEGVRVGIAQVTQVPGGVFIEAEFTGLAPGTHGFHIHEAGVCDPPFTSAGGHFNPDGRSHGRDNPAGSHIGDLPNIFVPDSRILTVSIIAEGATLERGVPESLAGNNGTALVVHQDADDYVTDPAGAAGPRIACGVIYPSLN
jgi:Cu-Zn family superoxide dismutase